MVLEMRDSIKNTGPESALPKDVEDYVFGSFEDDGDSELVIKELTPESFDMIFGTESSQEKDTYFEQFQKDIDQYHHMLEEAGVGRESLQNKLDEIESKKDELLSDPKMLSNSVATERLINSYNQKITEIKKVLDSQDLKDLRNKIKNELLEKVESSESIHDLKHIFNHVRQNIKDHDLLDVLLNLETINIVKHVYHKIVDEQNSARGADKEAHENFVKNLGPILESHNTERALQMELDQKVANNTSTNQESNSTPSIPEVDVVVARETEAAEPTIDTVAAADPWGQSKVIADKSFFEATASSDSNAQITQDPSIESGFDQAATGAQVQVSAETPMPVSESVQETSSAEKQPEDIVWDKEKPLVEGVVENGAVVEAVTGESTLAPESVIADNYANTDAKPVDEHIAKIQKNIGVLNGQTSETADLGPSNDFFPSENITPSTGAITPEAQASEKIVVNEPILTVVDGGGTSPESDRPELNILSGGQANESRVAEELVTNVAEDVENTANTSTLYDHIDKNNAAKQVVADSGQSADLVTNQPTQQDGNIPQGPKQSWLSKLNPLKRKPASAADAEYAASLVRDEEKIA